MDNHEHTTHALRDVVEALPRYERAGVSVLVGSSAWPSGMRQSDQGEWLKLADVRAVVHKAATLGAPVAYLDDHDERTERSPN